MTTYIPIEPLTFTGFSPFGEVIEFRGKTINNNQGRCEKYPALALFSVVALSPSIPIFFISLNPSFCRLICRFWSSTLWVVRCLCRLIVSHIWWWWRRETISRI